MESDHDQPSRASVVSEAESGDFEECNRFARLLLFAAKNRDLEEVTRLLGGDFAPAQSPGSRDTVRSAASGGHGTGTGVPFSDITSVRRVIGSTGEQQYNAEIIPSGLISAVQTDEDASRVATTLLDLLAPCLDSARAQTTSPGTPGSDSALPPDRVAFVRDAIITVAQHCKRLTSQVAPPPCWPWEKTRPPGRMRGETREDSWADTHLASRGASDTSPPGASRSCLAIYNPPPRG